jgi:hypothetical protein
MINHVAPGLGLVVLRQPFDDRKGVVDGVDVVSRSCRRRLGDGFEALFGARENTQMRYGRVVRV